MISSNNFLDRLELDVPIIQAPMAGTSNPEMAAAVSNAGGLGSLGIGASTVDVARGMIQKTKSLTDRSFNANVFCHRSAHPDPENEAAWLNMLAPEFARFKVAPPEHISEIYTSFLADDEMFHMLLDENPAVVSFHFGLPVQGQIMAFKRQGIVTLATATNLDEARQIEAAGIDAVVAQGWEAGGHRGCFDPDAPDARHGTLELAYILVKNLSIPVIAAGGMMDGAGINAALSVGATAAQLGTAFIACDESNADAAYRQTLKSDGARRTVMTRVISGRPARCLPNAFTAWGGKVSNDRIPDYPTTYDAGKALNAAAKSAGEHGFGAQWAGQGAPLSREMSADQLMQNLTLEMQA